MAGYGAAAPTGLTSMCINEIIAQHSPDLEILLAHILKCQTIELYKNPHTVITPAQYARFQKLIKKYNRGYPVAYLTGHKEFMSLDFEVTPAVLIPRPETELLAEQAIESIEPLRDKLRAKSIEKMLVVLDVGTGSGNIAISIAKHCRVKNLRIIASDISKKALTIAWLNVKRHQVSKYIQLCHGDLFKPFKGVKADMIVSNPPYVDRAEKSKWQAGLRYEPAKALWAGKKGMAYIEQIITRAPEYLQPGGWLLLEIGQGQAKATLRIIKATRCFRDIKILNDYNSIPRILTANRC